MITMLPNRKQRQVLLALFLPTVLGLVQPNLNTPTTTRRKALTSFFGSTASVALVSLPHLGSLVAPTLVRADESAVTAAYEWRDRKNNKDALIREDYWYMMGKTPPRVLQGPLKGDDPQFNAFGSCESAVEGGGNPCTYVSLKQRIPAYSKYGNSIAYGSKDVAKLGSILRTIQQKSGNDADDLWTEAASLVLTEEKTYPPPLVDAELKMILFATAMLTSPNFPTPSRELLVARFYANECHFSSGELASAIRARDLPRALRTWEFGRDSWNSYFQVVNRTISPKVGDKFEAIV